MKPLTINYQLDVDNSISITFGRQVANFAPQLHATGTVTTSSLNYAFFRGRVPDQIHGTDHAQLRYRSPNSDCPGFEQPSNGREMGGNQKIMCQLRAV